MLLSLLLAATPTLSVPPNADLGFPCPAHQQLLDLGRTLELVEPLVVRFEVIGGERWRISATGLDNRRVLTRELSNPCAQLAPLTIAILQRYLTSVTLPRAQLVLRPKVKPSPVSVTPDSVTEGSPPSPVEPVEAPQPPPTEPSPAVPVAPEVPIERPRAPLEVRRLEPAAPPRLSLAPAVGLGLWWEASGGLAPTLVLEGELGLGVLFHLGLVGTARWPQAQAVSLPEGRAGTLSTWSSNALASLGACGGTATRWCGDAVVGARFAIATATGALYQRREVVLVLPTAGARVQASIRLSSSLAITIAVLATVPWGRSAASIEGSSASYATPPLDLLAIIGLRLTP